VVGGLTAVARTMATLLSIYVCLAWYVYLANTEMFLSSREFTLDQAIGTSNAANELVCYRLCKKTFGCNAFSFFDGQCHLAQGSIVGSSSGFVYTRLGAQASQVS